MFLNGQVKRWTLAASLLVAWAGAASGQEIHYQYVRLKGNNVMPLPAQPSYVYIRGRVYYFSPPPQPVPPAPNTWLEFLHPYSHAYVVVPVNLPNAIPQIENRDDRVVYKYGGYSVVIQFVRDGSVNVTYQSLN
jgi:hypothetical protein